MSIYLDNAATAPLRKEAREAMLSAYDCFGNPSSLHAEGLAAKKLLSTCRKEIADSLSVNPREIFFTSGGTESDNWAIKGYAEANADKGRHIIISAIEHHAVIETCEYLKRRGFRITVLPVDANGRVLPETLRNAFCEDTVLVSIMTVNNETGTIERISELSELANRRGIAFHTDSVQALGHIPTDYLKDVSMASFSAHKFGGPKGTGILYVKEGIRLAPLLHGGGQEQFLRSGTENVPAIAGMAKALTLAVSGQKENEKYLAELRRIFLNGLSEGCGDFTVNGGENTIPSTLNISFPGVEAASVLVLLDLAGICCSGGSACTSGRNEPSHVLAAMGVGPDRIRGSIRISFSTENTAEEARNASKTLADTVLKLRKISSPEGNGV